MLRIFASAFTDQLSAWGSVGAAFGTVAAFTVAFLQIRTERRARKKLERQADVQAHRAQADCVHAWFSGDDGKQTILTMLNGSGEPVYRAAVFLVFIQGAAPHTGKEWVAMQSENRQVSGLYRFLSVIPPGTFETTVQSGWGAMMARPAAEIAFTDRSGAHWLRGGDGVLTQIDVPAQEYYGLDAPVDWQVPSPAPLRLDLGRSDTP